METNNQEPNYKKRRIIAGMVAVIFICSVYPVSTFVVNFVTRGAASELNYGIASDDESGDDSEVYDNLDDTVAIDEIKGWSMDVYDAITVATELYDYDSETRSYSDGDKYEELVTKVGKPNKKTSYSEDNGSPAYTVAEWNIGYDGRYAGASVSISYTTDNLMIIDKHAY
jgi:hypothetical protein